jgi:putative acetyltransferase
MRWNEREPEDDLRKYIRRKMKYLIRNEKPEDYRAVEEITRLAFWNVHVPGCNEHYLVHTMRDHKDFMRELDYVMTINNEIIGNIMYTRSWLLDESRQVLEIITFGPVSIAPKYQRKGFGSILINHSIAKAVQAGEKAIVIYGNPGLYVKFGFKSCRKYRVTNENNEYPTALLVKELKAGALGNQKWIYKESEVYSIDESEADHFDQGFEKMERRVTDRQEEFHILANSRVMGD